MTLTMEITSSLRRITTVVDPKAYYWVVCSQRPFYYEVTGQKKLRNTCLLRKGWLQGDES